MVVKLDKGVHKGFVVVDQPAIKLAIEKSTNHQPSIVSVHLANFCLGHFNPMILMFRF